MRTRAALLWSQPGKWEVTDVELDDPRDDEVLIRIVAAGLCHSDDHLRSGDLPAGPLPMCGGHEGAGIVEATGSAVRHLRPGDHVVLSFIPSCGRCRWCAQGLQNLCDNGAKLKDGAQLDGTYRMHKDGQDVGQFSLVSTFSQYTVVNQSCCVKIPEDIPLREASLLGCGVPTGWGAAVVAAGVRPGDVTIVMGVGGIGINAVQGAAHAGASRIIAVDPVPFKREFALTVGATDACSDMREAKDRARSVTNGQGADNAIVTVGVTTADHVAEAFSAVRKAGTLAVIGIGNIGEAGPPINLFELVMYQKRIQGAIYGSLSPHTDIPRLAAMYRTGQLKLTELITRTYSLEEVNEGYAHMHAGRNIRGVITFD